MKKYYSLDMERAGANALKHSILSFGAVIVGEEENTFYRELKPIFWEYQRKAIAIGCEGLECLTQKLRKLGIYDPKSPDFRPDLALRELNRVGSSAREAMHDFVNWVNNTSNGAEPIIIIKGKNLELDFLMLYLEKFLGKNHPFSKDSFLDLHFMYQEITNDHNKSLKHLGIMNTRTMEHNGLSDAHFQAKQAEEILKLKK